MTMPVQRERRNASDMFSAGALKHARKTLAGKPGKVGQTLKVAHGRPELALTKVKS